MEYESKNFGFCDKSILSFRWQATRLSMRTINALLLTKIHNWIYKLNPMTNGLIQMWIVVGLFCFAAECVKSPSVELGARLKNTFGKLKIKNDYMETN